MCGIEDRFVLSGPKFLLKYKTPSPLPSPEARGSQLRQPEAGENYRGGFQFAGLVAEARLYVPRFHVNFCPQCCSLVPLEIAHCGKTKTRLLARVWFLKISFPDEIGL